MENIISVKNITKKFDDYTAIRNLTFDVRQGEIFGFLGPSGAGKTTTIKILTSQLLPTGGEATVFNKQVHTQKKDLFQHIGVLTDNSGLYERLSARDNLSLFAEIHRVPTKSIDQILEKVGLLAFSKTEAKNCPEV